MEELISSFAAWDTNPATQPLHEAMRAECASPSAVTKEAFSSRLEFGTAGLRGPMGCGLRCMNEVTVMQAAQGLVAHLLVAFPDAPSRGLVVGWDHRAQGGLTSRRFALLTAAVCAARGVRCHLFSALVATPMVPFAILRLGAAAGVMVTASHNPKEDNGYKVYWANGAQIISPVDKAIAAAIAANAAPWDRAAYGAALDGGAGEAALLARCALDPLTDILPAYLSTITSALCRNAAGNSSGEPRPGITYTAMHGVGLPFAQAAFKAFNLPPFTLVERQVQPDPDFSTVAVSAFWATAFSPLPAFLNHAHSSLSFSLLSLSLSLSPFPFPMLCP